MASKCGYTPQYADLQKLHEQFGGKVTILGFPANNFGAQEPGTNVEIAQFCEKNYGVTFQMFEKISVKGDDQHPLYKCVERKNRSGTELEFLQIPCEGRRDSEVLSFEGQSAGQTDRE